MSTLLSSRHLPRRRRAALVAASLVAVGATAVTAVPATAAGETVTYTPGTVVSGGTVSFGGTGWTPLGNVTISVSGPGSANLCTLRASSTGVIPATACALPTFLPFGSYTVTGTSATATKNAAGTLKLTANAGVTQPNGAVAVTAAAGTDLGANGSGFAPSSAIKVRVDGANVPTTPATPVSNANGQVGGITFTLPAGTTAGVHEISLKDGLNHVAAYSITVYRPTLSFGGAAVTAGEPVPISGAGWPGGDSIQVFMNRANPPASGFLCTVRANGNGVIATQTCNAPTNLPFGVYKGTGVDINRYATLAGGNITLNPRADVLNPGFGQTFTAASGTLVQLSGAGFNANGRITATVNGVAAPTTPAVARASATGVLSGTSIVIPAATPAGKRDVVLSDPAGHSATYTLTVYKPTITMTPANAAAGTPVTVAGSGWPAGDTISVQLTSAAGTSTVCNVPTTSTGDLVTPSQQCFAPGNLPFGTYALTGSSFQRYVTRTGANSNLSASATLTDTGGTPIASGAAGSTVVAQGAGFAGGSTITVRFNGTNRPTTPSPASSGANGSVSGVSFTVPSLAPGTYPVQVRDASGHIATVSFTIV